MAPGLSAGQSKLVLALHRRKARETEGLFLAEGIRAVEELAGSGFDLRFALAATSLVDTARGAALRQAVARKCAVHDVADHELKRFAATDQPQGIVVIAAIPDFALDRLAAGQRGVLLIADAVQDPGNLGTLVRVADAFAADAVITLPGTVDIWNPKTVRSSAGSLFHLPVFAAQPARLQDWLQRHRFDVLGADAAGEPADAAQLGERVALIAGNEGAGLSADARSMATRIVSVQMPGRAESLNVAVAAGILLYIVSRR